MEDRIHLPIVTYPEVPYGDLAAYEALETEVEELFWLFGRRALALKDAGGLVRKAYEELDPILSRLTSDYCSCCATGCCVNRHGFPDYEDLVAFRAMGVERAGFDPTLPEQGLCQYLGRNGCILPRYKRSYRCTWFFCDDLLDRFEQEDPVAFDAFDKACDLLSARRKALLQLFGRLCTKYGRPILSWPEGDTLDGPCNSNGLKRVEDC